jgi:hypothetical protein
VSKSVWTIVSLGLLGACAKGGGARPADALVRGDVGRAALPDSQREPECLQCVLEDLREAAHKDQVVVTARYLGLAATWLDGRRTRQRCTPDQEVMGSARFALLGEHPWRGRPPPPHGQRAEIMAADLPCPELSRPAYAHLYRYDPDDTRRDGLGHAPVLRRGSVYQLTFVRAAPAVAAAPGPSTDPAPALTLVAVNPAQGDGR